MPIRGFLRWFPPCAALLALMPALAGAPLAAQSLTAGGLTATVVDENGAPLKGVTVTIERRGTAFRLLETDHAGRVALPVLAVGRYDILAEQFGFQPVRSRGADVVAGGMTAVSIRLARRPPPINSVTDQPAVATVTTPIPGRRLAASDLTRLDRRRDAGDATRSLTDAIVPTDGRDGALLGAFGHGAAQSHLTVDGVQEAFLRHPGLPSEAPSTPLFARDGLAQLLATSSTADAEFRSTPGLLLSGLTQRGGERFSFRPYAAFSGSSLGAASADNPGDSSATSIEGGVAMGGPLKGDTASWFLRADYRQLETPTADPFVVRNGADPRAGIAAAAAQLGASNAGTWLVPTIRGWKGGSVMGRIDWRLSDRTQFAARFGGASWTEESAQVGTAPVSGAGNKLEAKDVSGALALTHGGEEWISETRFGMHSAKRDWFGAALPYTGFVAEGIAIGDAPSLPGAFKETGFELGETMTYRSGAHLLKGGAVVRRTNSTFDWVPGSAGRYDVGSAAGFATPAGAFYQAIRTGAADEIGLTEIAAFAEDLWQLRPTFALTFGARYQKSQLPDDLVKAYDPWGRVTGQRNEIVPPKKTGVAPRAGFIWQATPKTTFRASGGMIAGDYDLLALAEASQFDGDVKIRRLTGALTWPRLGEASGASIVGPALTIFGPDVRRPRDLAGEASLAQQFDAATTLTVSGAYRHGDYRLRRDDINRAVAPLSTAVDGRSVWGSLEQYGGLLVPTVGSNRRFRDFDMVYGLTSTGYSDYYGATVTLERRVTSGLSLLASYTYSKTEDNLVGQLASDPADRLSPFADGRGVANWDEGRSDLDVPHRFSATATFATGGSTPISVAARYRYRSGLPFTAGFRRGVDANGDGSGGNDPAALAASIPGMADLVSKHACLKTAANGIATRNACRDDAVGALDLRLEVGLPVGGARRVLLTVDAFNVVSTETGLFDHAAVLVNPAGTVAIDAAGRTALPLIANPDFGTLLSRRGEPRAVRIGLRVEN